MDWHLCKQYFPGFEDEDIEKFLMFCVNEAQERMEMGDVCYYNYYPQKKKYIQLVIEARRCGKQYEVDNLMFHHVGWGDKQIWEMVYNDLPIEIDNTCFFGFSKSKGGGIIRLVNKDVLEDLEDGQVFRAQVCGIALDINVFEDEDSCCEFLRNASEKKTVFLEDGLLAPLNFIANHVVKPRRGDEKIDYSDDGLVTVKGKITKCYTFENDFDGIEAPKYYGVTMNISNAGELLVLIDPLLLSKGKIKQIAKDNIILADILLSGDPCVGKYEKFLKKREVEKSDTEKSPES